MRGPVLVTGATGFIGRHLVAALAARGVAVRAGVRKGARGDFGPPVEDVAVPDLAAPADWTGLLKGVQGVVHLAGIAHATTAIESSVYERVNGAAAGELAAAAAGVARFVLMSSIRAQSGPVSNKVLTENDNPEPTDAYGRSKLMAERLVLQAFPAATVLRPVLVYGPGVKGNMARLIKLAGVPIPVAISKL